MTTDFIQALSRQPLFRIMSAIIVLLLVDFEPVYGIIAFFVWFAWVWWGSHPHHERNPYPR